MITIKSFGFKYGEPFPEAEIFIDLRSKLKNPQSHLPNGVTGLDKIVYKTVLGTPQNQKVFDNIFNKVTTTLKESNEFTIAFGCRSGIHRSVVFAEECFSKLKKKKIECTIEHIHLKT